MPYIYIATECWETDKLQSFFEKCKIQTKPEILSVLALELNKKNRSYVYLKFFSLIEDSFEMEL